MTQLRPMPAAAFAPYMQTSVAGYAEDNVRANRWPREGALERSRAEFESLLPQGLHTPDNHVFEIMATANGPVVGVIWFAVEAKHGPRSAFVYDVEIHPPFRRQGHALRAFQALEPVVKALGLSAIGLHVFGHNPGAQALYARLGYGITGINMVKNLAGSGAAAAPTG